MTASIACDDATDRALAQRLARRSHRTEWRRAAEVLRQRRGELAGAVERPVIR